MRTSWLVSLVAVCVSLDVANPLMPGALSFGVEDSVEVRQAERFRGLGDPALVPATFLLERVARGEELAVSWTPATDVPWSWSLHAPRARSALPTLAPSSPDH